MTSKWEMAEALWSKYADCGWSGDAAAVGEENFYRAIAEALVESQRQVAAAYQAAAELIEEQLTNPNNSYPSMYEHFLRQTMKDIVSLTPASAAAELRRVAVQEAEWWHKRCCERVEVIGQPGVFQCFGCERIAALERAAKGEK